MKILILVLILAFMSEQQQPTGLQLIRDRDETGHRTGLGTLARSFASNPVSTFNAGRDFARNYNQMKAANLKGGNLAAHERANYEATIRMRNPNVASAFSAFRESSKNFRTPVSSSAHARKGWGDMRTRAEIKATMDANAAGRRRGMHIMQQK